MKNTILNRFNKALEPLTNNAEEISQILNQNTNLKLHEIVCLDEFDSNDFEFFCEVEFQEWTNFLEQHNLQTDYIGRTSSFYLNSKYYDMFNYEYNGKINARNLTKLICQNSGMNLDYIKVDDNGIISDLDNIEFCDGTSATWEEYFLEEHDIDSHVRDLVDEVEKFFEEFNEIKAGYEYLDNFKENQVKLYRASLGLN